MTVGIDQFGCEGARAHLSTRYGRECQASHSNKFSRSKTLEWHKRCRREQMIQRICQRVEPRLGLEAVFHYVREMGKEGMVPTNFD